MFYAYEKPSHIVSAWCKEDGFCLGQKAVEEKSNEITAIPDLLDKLQINGQVITIDAMGTQTAIAEKIKSKRAHYVLGIIMEKKTLKKGEKERVEYRYFISSLPEDTELASRAIRGHWSIESMHWHLDVTFREDANAKIDKTAAQNLNIIRKWCLSILKVTELSEKKLR